MGRGGSGGGGLIIGVDLLETEDVNGVHFLQGDFLRAETQQTMLQLMYWHYRNHNPIQPVAHPRTLSAFALSSCSDSDTAVTTETETTAHVADASQIAHTLISATGSTTPSYTVPRIAANVIMSDILHDTSGGRNDHYRSIDMARQIIRFAKTNLVQVDSLTLSKSSSGSAKKSKGSKNVDASTDKNGSSYSACTGSDSALVKPVSTTPLLHTGNKSNNSVLLFKVLMGEDLQDLLKEELEPYFEKVSTVKPRASRPTSREVYILARNLLRRH